MSTIQEVVPMKGSEQGLSMLIDSWRNQIKHDQQYREFQRNSIESIERVQKKDPLFKDAFDVIEDTIENCGRLEVNNSRFFK